jgi:hypothetical protein
MNPVVEGGLLSGMEEGWENPVPGSRLRESDTWYYTLGGRGGDMADVYSRVGMHFRKRRGRPPDFHQTLLLMALTLEIESDDPHEGNVREWCRELSGSERGSDITPEWLPYRRSPGPGQDRNLERRWREAKEE